MRHAVRFVLACAFVSLVACNNGTPFTPPHEDGGGVGRDAAVSGLTCSPCISDGDCAGGACVQYAGSDYCGKSCTGASDCAGDETCRLETSTNGTQVQVCVPSSGSCGGTGGCGTCPTGETCDTLTGTCMPMMDMSAPTGGTCGTYVAPDQSACCKSCSAGGSNCQNNGCYGGWWCDSATCKCHAPPSSCPSGNADMGTVNLGDLGMVAGTVNASGGTVSRLYFAIVGDTRPANIDDTSGYPTAIITKIYQDLDAMNPKPEFIVTTGDYMFASTSGSQQQAQMNLYMGAQKNWTGGPVFSAMGNHECTGATASNCASSPTQNYNVYFDSMVKPLGKTTPYYTIPISDTNGAWTAKFVIVACNDWDSTQQSWLQGELAKQTTYTFLIRHEPPGAAAPCVSAVDSLLRQYPYDQLLVGHTHTYEHSGKELVVGTGGAPITSSVPYGYATVEQTGSGFVVTQYDYSTATPISTYTFQ